MVHISTVTVTVYACNFWISLSSWFWCLKGSPPKVVPNFILHFLVFIKMQFGDNLEDSIFVFNFSLCKVFLKNFSERWSGGCSYFEPHYHLAETYQYSGSRLELLCKKVFIKISRNSQEKTCARVSFLTKFSSVQFWLCAS